jgi:hypothetical protein
LLRNVYSDRAFSERFERIDVTKGVLRKGASPQYHLMIGCEVSTEKLTIITEHLANTIIQTLKIEAKKSPISQRLRVFVSPEDLHAVEKNN